ncbi:MAG: DUF1837 domain-containing protein [Anaerolineales bacterium]|nr:DUF1837 domain-containing protein [Anaerolineales bacterium]
MGYIADKISWQQETSTGKFLDGEIWIGQIDNNTFASIADKHGDALVTCYIDRQHLASIAAANNKTENEILKSMLPNKPNMRSGDFGEILSRSVLQEWKDAPTFPANRWRNRSTPNEMIQGTDLVGYLFKGNEPHKDDLLVFCEVKTRENGGDKDVVRIAYEGAVLDNTTRLVNSLVFLQYSLLRDGLGDEAKKLARFSDPYSHPYQKRIAACVVHETNKWKTEYLDVLPDRHELPEEFFVIIIQLEELAKWIDHIYENAQ